MTLSNIVIDDLDASRTEIKKYPLPRNYHNTDEQYELILVEENGKIFLSDQGRTVRILDKIFELGSCKKITFTIVRLSWFDDIVPFP